MTSAAATVERSSPRGRAPAPHPPRGTVTARRIDGQRDWFVFIAAHDRQGGAWVERFRRDGFRALANATQDALASLRAKEPTKGKEQLDRIARRARAFRTRSPSMFQVVERFRLAVEAYYFYCLDDFDIAARRLDQALESVERAISLEPRLLPLADSALDFGLQHIRVRRAQRDWHGMRDQIAHVRSIVAGERPLCRIDGRHPVTMADVARFYRQLDGLSRENQLFIRDIVDGRLQRDVFERFVAYVYVPSHIVHSTH